MLKDVHSSSQFAGKYHVDLITETFSGSHEDQSTVKGYNRKHFGIPEAFTACYVPIPM